MKKVETLVQRLYEERHQEELDTVLPVIGPEGAGKSTLILQIAVAYIMKRDGEPPEIDDLLDRIAYSRADFKEMLAQSEKQAVIMAPDAGRIFYSMDVSTSEQKTLEKDMMDVRGLEYMIILGFQDFDRIGGQIDERRAKLALRVPRRGLVRGYGREAMDERIDEGEWPESTMTDSFPPLDGTDLWDEYQRVDEEEKRERLAGEGNRDPEDVEKEVQRKIAIRAVKPWAPSSRVGLTQRDASKLIDYSESWVSETIRDWKDGEYRDLVEAKDAVIA